MQTIADYYGKKKARKARAKANAKFQAKAKTLTTGQKAKAWVRTKVEAMLWEITSILVRSRDARKNRGLCLICSRNPIECSYHLVPAGHGSWAKWALEAMVGACCDCNLGEQMNRLKYHQKHKELFGAEFIDGLVRKSTQTVRYSTADLRQMYDERRSVVQRGDY